MLLIKLIDARRGLHNKCVELFGDQKIAEEIYRKLCDGIEDCETVEAEPKHGRWIYEQLPLPLSDGSKECVRCSVCGTHWDNESTYCPYCGADMRERKDNG